MARLNNITFACGQPVELAEFWREALGYEDRAAEVKRLTGLGTTFVEERSLKIGPYEETFEHAGTGLILSPPTREVMKDPEGNGFCVS